MRGDTRFWIATEGASMASVYISCDIEADGPIPGEYSMSSFGLCVAATVDRGGVTVCDPWAMTFYAELKPISDKFVPEAAAVSGLNRDDLIAHGKDPSTAMRAAGEWVAEVKRSFNGYKPVFAAYPASYDWGWMYWYFIKFAGDSPFGFSNVLDMKTFYAAVARVELPQSRKSNMPNDILGSRRRDESLQPHQALNDAVCQADLLANLLRLEGDPWVSTRGSTASS
jgi:hypothetical protein